MLKLPPLALGSAAIVLAAATGALLGTWTDQPVPWWIGRAAGLSAYLLAWVSMLAGVAVAGRLRAPAALFVHRRASLVAAGLALLHVGALLFDPFAKLRLLDVALPFFAAHDAAAVGLGTVAGWGFFVLVGSTALVGRLSREAWRAIHAVAFGTWALTLAHGWAAGTSSLGLLYLSTGAVLVAAIVVRIALAVAPTATAAPHARSPGAPGAGTRG